MGKSNNATKPCFFKFSPLLDPVRYMVGKYEITTDLLTLPTLSNNICHKKIIDTNNSAYVDGFFSYLTSQLLHSERFCHGLDFYGSFIGVKKQFKYDIFDDLEYLNESKFFHNNKGKIFHLNGLEEDIFTNKDSRGERTKLKLSDSICNISVSSFKSKEFDKVFSNNETNDQNSKEKASVNR